MGSFFEKHAKTVGLAGLGAGLAAAVLLRILNYEMRRDEQLYASAGKLLEGGAPYADFFYNHVPASAWLFRLMNILAPGDHVLLAARLGVFAGWLLLGLALAWITWRLTRSLAMSVFAVLVLIANDVLLGVVGMTATNNFLPLPFIYLGLALFVLGLEGRRVWGDDLKSDGEGRGPAATTIALAGVSLAVAASMKVSAGVAIPPVVAASLLAPAGIAFVDRLRRVTGPLAIGGVLGALPVIVSFLRGPERFLAHVVGFHTGPHIEYWAANSGPGGEPVAMSAPAKALLAFEVLLSGVNIVLILVAAILFALYALGRRLRAILEDGALMLVVATLGLTLVMSFVPTPAFPQYFAPPLAVAPLFLAMLFARLDARLRPQLELTLAVASGVVLVLAAPRLLQHAPKIVRPDAWTVNRVHNAGADIAARMEAAGLDGKVATLLPLYALEGDLPVYPEFATGQFAYRLADLTDDDLLRHYVTTSPTRVRALFDIEPPDAILVGFEPALERPFVEFAQSKGYRRVEDFRLKDRYGEGVLYLRADAP